MIQQIKLSELNESPNNPRYISEKKFEALKKSIEDFPEMLELRPLVVRNGFVIGGNMRFKALLALGKTEAPVLIADNLTDEQVLEFVIKDNLPFGSWDYDILGNEWNNDLLIDWGMDVWNPTQKDLFDIDEEKEEEDKITPKATDTDYSVFELVMLHKNKLELLSVLSKVKERQGLEKQEEALMYIIKTYKNE